MNLLIRLAESVRSHLGKLVSPKPFRRERGRRLRRRKAKPCLPLSRPCSGRVLLKGQEAVAAYLASDEVKELRKGKRGPRLLPLEVLRYEPG
jgi:hypothetical protein